LVCLHQRVIQIIASKS